MVFIGEGESTVLWFSKMHFAENSAFVKILKLFIRSDYAERDCVWLKF